MGYIDINKYGEDEIQALITLAELAYPREHINNNSYKPFPETEAEAREYFRRYAEDTSTAYVKLRDKGLVEGEDTTPALTEEGRAAADELRRLRPPIYYWYREFYGAIDGSRAFREYCRRVMGEYRGQHGFSDMAQIDKMLDRLKLDRNSRVLDIGCGIGRIAEYISDRTGAAVTGIDYIPEAIEQAKARTRDKQDRLRFVTGNLEEIDIPGESFDCLISLDTIYFGQADTLLRAWKRLLKPGGQMAVFYLSMQGDDLAAPLEENGLEYAVYDLSRENHEHQQLKHRAAAELRDDFEAEGNLFIWRNLMEESVSHPAPYDPAKTTMRRYLYHVTKPG